MEDVNDLRTISKEQLHSSSLKTWNYRGTTDFSAFVPDNVLAGDNWVSNATTYVSVNDITLFPGDMVMALEDQPGDLTKANIEAGKWKISRNTGTSGSVMVFSHDFYIKTNPFDPEYNYNLATGILSIPNLEADFLRLTDNVNLCVNSMKYSYRHFIIIESSNKLYWKANVAEFNLEDEDYIEIEIFRK